MRAHTRFALAIGLAAGCAVGGSIGCGPGVPQTLPETHLSESRRELYASRHLLRARALRDEGRLEDADRAVRLGLEFAPDEPHLLRLHADLLEEHGAHEEARQQRARADAVDPPPAPPPDTALALPSSGLLIVLLAPPEADELRDQVPRSWPDGEVARTLTERLRLRLPEAELELPEPESVGAARAWIAEREVRAVLSLRVDRAFCGETLKDGRFAVAWLRVATASAANPDEKTSSTADVVRTVLDRPSESCPREAVVRGLEAVLDRPAVRQALATARPPKDASQWTSATLRTLFPELSVRIREHTKVGRRLLARGLLGEAAESFRRAAAIDPDDPAARAFLREIDTSLALSRQLSAATATTEQPEDPDDLQPGFSAAQRRTIELQLREEQQKRKELLASLALLEDDRRSPPYAALSILRPATIADPDATGPRLARGSSQKSVEARVLYAPSGEPLFRYYFRGNEKSPVLREDDDDGDGRPDRWTGYSSQVRRDVWEDSRGTGLPDRHLVYARDGDALERLEIDGDGDGRPERIIRYADGLVRTEDRDTNGDGRADLFERFDPSGSVEQREEDLDGDGEIDVRTSYRSGRVVRREIVNTEFLREFE